MHTHAEDKIQWLVKNQGLWINRLYSGTSLTPDQMDELMGQLIISMRADGLYPQNYNPTTEPVASLIVKAREVIVGQILSSLG